MNLTQLVSFTTIMESHSYKKFIGDFTWILKKKQTHLIIFMLQHDYFMLQKLQLSRAVKRRNRDQENKSKRSNENLLTNFLAVFLTEVEITRMFKIWIYKLQISSFLQTRYNGADVRQIHEWKFQTEFTAIFNCNRKVYLINLKS